MSNTCEHARRASLCRYPVDHNCVQHLNGQEYLMTKKRERKTILSLLEFSRKNKFVVVIIAGNAHRMWTTFLSLFFPLQKKCVVQTVHTCSMLELIGMKRFWFFVSLCDSSLHTNWNVFRHHILSFVSIEKIVNAFWQIVNVCVRLKRLTDQFSEKAISICCLMCPSSGRVDISMPIANTFLNGNSKSN